MVTAGVILALISSIIFICATSPWMLYLARAVEGIALGVFMGTSNALLLHHTSQQYIKRSLAGLLPALIIFGTIVTLIGAGIIAVPKISERKKVSSM